MRSRSSSLSAAMSTVRTIPSMVCYTARLLADLIERARSNDCNVYQGFATAIEKSTLYFAWREVLLQLIEVTANVDPAHVQEQLMDGDF